MTAILTLIIYLVGSIAAYLLIKYAEPWEGFKFAKPHRWTVGKRAEALIYSIFSYVVIAVWLILSGFYLISSLFGNSYFKRPAKW